MKLLSAFDFSQMFGDTAAFDGNAGTSGNTSALPFQTVAGPLDSVGSTSSTGFFGNLLNGVSKGALAAIPAVLSNLTSKSDPNPAAAAAEQRTTAEKQAAQNSGVLKWVLIIGGGLAVVGGVLWLVLRGGKKRG